MTHPPIGSQTVFPDYVSGTLCAIIIISGVLHRDRHKKGAFIDLAQSGSDGVHDRREFDGSGVDGQRS